MGVACDEADAGEAAGDQRAQEGDPGGAVLARDDDKWTAVIISQATDATVGAVPATKAKTGNGRTTNFSGTVTLGTEAAPFVGTAKLLIVYGDGVDDFPAGLEVEILCSFGPCTITHDF